MVSQRISKKKPKKRKIKEMEKTLSSATGISNIVVIWP